MKRHVKLLGLLALLLAVAFAGRTTSAWAEVASPAVTQPTTTILVSDYFDDTNYDYNTWVPGGFTLNGAYSAYVPPMRWSSRERVIVVAVKKPYSVERLWLDGWDEFDRGLIWLGDTSIDESDYALYKVDRLVNYPGTNTVRITARNACDVVTKTIVFGYDEGGPNMMSLKAISNVAASYRINVQWNDAVDSQNFDALVSPWIPEPGAWAMLPYPGGQASGIEKIEVQRSTDSITWQTAATLPGQDRSYSDFSPLKRWGRNYYRVRACDRAGNWGPYSASASVSNSW